MALSDERIDDLAQNYGLDWLDYEPFARAIEYEVREQYTALILQLVEALENSSDLVFKDTTKADARDLAISAGRARLEGKP